MNLEQALQENTAAVLRLTELLSAQQLTVAVEATDPAEISKAAVQEAIAETATATESAEIETKQVTKEVQTSEKTEATTHTYDDVKVALMSVAKVSRAKLQTILDEFGVANISAIDPNDYSRVIELAEKALETADA